MNALKLSLAALLVLLTACGSTVTNPVTGRAERTVMDERTELEEGRKAHKEVLEEYGVYNDTALQAYVNDVGQKLAKLSHRSTLAWTFTVVDSPEINAFALPGGYIYITRGIMAHLNSEAELAGVLGHEIGHVTARHGAQRATRQQQAGLGVLAASVLGAVLEGRYGLGGLGDLASQTSQAAAAGYVAKYGREQELQADSLGAEYLARSGYNPRTMINVIAALKDQERFAADQPRAQGKQVAQRDNWLSSHPSNDQRLNDITQLAQKFPVNSADDGRARYMHRINGMAFGDSREQGLVRGNSFYHEPMGFVMTAPPGWKIQNSQDALLLVNAQGTAGLRLVAVPPQAGNSHDEIIRNALKPTQGRVERYSINGFAATHFSGARQTQQGAQNIDATIVTGPKNTNYALLYLAQNADGLARNRAEIAQAEKSFRAFADADRNVARPYKLRTTTFPRGGFAQLAQATPLGASAQAQLRLINGVYSGGEPAAGQVVKTVE
ncbi:MAG: M48 family metalloprotease [Burkholderiaceae bacterium]